MNISIKELTELVGGILKQGDASALVTGFSTIQEAEPGDVTFLGNSRYAPQLAKSQASVVLVDASLADIETDKALIIVDNSTLQFGIIVAKFGPQPRLQNYGVHPTAVVDASVQLDATEVYVGPNAVIEAGVTLGKGCVINAGVFIGFGSSLGENCVLHANVTLKEYSKLGNRVVIHSGSVIGSDGFGYQLQDGKHVKIDQVGIVQLDDDVEVGSCTTIDRSRFGRTWIGEGTKIDNLVQIAHNVIIGKHSLIVSQVGISGSARLGNYVTIAGQSGVSGHIAIGDQTLFLGRSGVIKDHPNAGIYMGYPSRPISEGRRIAASTNRLPQLVERIRALETKLQQLEEKLGQSEV